MPPSLIRSLLANRIPAQRSVLSNRIPAQRLLLSNHSPARTKTNYIPQLQPDFAASGQQASVIKTKPDNNEESENVVLPNVLMIVKQKVIKNLKLNNPKVYRNRPT
jgi:hypothetical protein